MLWSRGGKRVRLEPENWVERGSYRKCVLVSVPGKGVLIQLVQVPAGKRVGEHYHTHQTEFYYILRGRAQLRIGEEVYLAERGDTYLCGAGEVHSVDNSAGSEPFELLVVKLNYKEEDSVWLG